MTDVATTEKKCPECNQVVPVTVTLCRHCGFVFTAAKGEAAPTPTAAIAPTIGHAPTSVWSAARVLFSRRTVLVIAGLLVVFVAMAYWLTRVGQEQRAATPDEEFAEVLAPELPGSPQVIAADGHCRIVMRADAADLKIDAQATANDALKRYAAWRSRYNKDERVVVEVFFGDTRVAEAKQ